MSADFRETLYTIDSRGRRKWVYSQVVKGAFFNKRALVIYLLMAIYLLMPWLVINGEQAVYFDIFHRRFVILGQVFFATDTFFLFLVLVGAAMSLFFFTAVFGRVWCGWACPETVFLEFLFRPLERLIEGSSSARLKLDQSPWNLKKIRIKGFKYFVFAIAAWVLASTFLAYFIGREQLVGMMSTSPWSNPVPFFLTIIQMFVVLFQFGWFREQFCTVLCPYARFQSVLMDSNSIGVMYDAQRGEPRGKARQQTSEKVGDCVDCGLCTKVCPTGIDIRNGSQLECIHCAQCVDACNSVMAKLGRPLGLIRYDTEARLRSGVGSIIRPRIFVYGALLTVVGSLLLFRLSTRVELEGQLLRGGLDVPYSVQADGRVLNHLTLRVQNKGAREKRVMTNGTVLPEGFQVIMPGSPYPVSAESVVSVPIFISFPQSALVKGTVPIELALTSDQGEKVPLKMTLLGPG